jgi:hypothetical protein
MAAERGGRASGADQDGARRRSDAGAGGDGVSPRVRGRGAVKATGGSASDERTALEREGT